MFHQEMINKILKNTIDEMNSIVYYLGSVDNQIWFKYIHIETLS
jgi:hypothetical protein